MRPRDGAPGGRDADDRRLEGRISMHLGLALGHLLHDDAGMLLVDVDDDLLDRLEKLALLILLEDDARP